MKVLFVCGGISVEFGIPPLIKAQGESLKNNNIEIEYFGINRNGLSGYILYIYKLKRYLKNNPVDIIHAHFSFAGVVASLTFTRTPIVVSLLGSDVFGKSFVKQSILLCRKLFSWDALIVKSLAMNQRGGVVIPNGVDTSIFKPLDSIECKKQLAWDHTIRHILFAANPDRPEKNFILADRAIKLLGNNIQLHSLKNISHKEMPIWFNASDVIILTSLWEGSPNVIKEAMACNRPIISTEVGDIRWLFGEKTGHYIADSTPKALSLKIKQALDFHKIHKKTTGRNRIIELGLDSSSIAKRIISLYKSLLR